ncbi:MAG: PrsW family glutamic-type intramembrane protease [Candidatus Pacebacteria bacterium]|nr:PrsW family glutamic-type intramembrane protease [Candidatus Paceibacterota bacterium]
MIPQEVIIFSAGLLPSFIWLLFYLRKDSHPEPNYLILKVFIFGVLSGFLAIFLEKGFQKGENFLGMNNLLLITFLVSGVIEEGVKFLAVKIGLYKTSEPDEPIDWILFMIISALGFAALENVLVLSNQEAITSLGALEFMLFRFVSATFLHALCSGMIGYFWILSRCKNKKAYLWLGFFLIAGLHGFYNWSIMGVEGINKFLLPIVIIMTLSLLLSLEIKHLKKLKSVCEINNPLMKASH